MNKIGRERIYAMSTISHDVILRKPGGIAIRTLRKALGFATIRGDSHIEPVHWLATLPRLRPPRPLIHVHIGVAAADFGHAFD